MTVKVANSLFITSSITRFGALYQHVLKSVSSFQKLGDRLIQEANAAQAFRHIDKIEEIGRLLSNIPIREYQLIGQYYIGLVGSLRGETPRALLEEVVECSNMYRAKALISIAVIEARKGDYASELYCFTEALKYANTPSTKIEVLRGIAIIKAKEGFNRQSLQDLEAILPLARYGDVRVCHDYLNSYAVELIEAGRIEEATNISNIVLASPYAFAYPEWRETGAETARRGYKSRSSIPIIKSFSEPEKQLEKIQNVLYMPGRNTAPVRLRTKPAKVLSYIDWKEKMVKEENDEIPPDADEGDLYLRLMELIALKDLSTWELRQVIDFVEKLRPNAEKN